MSSEVYVTRRQISPKSTQLIVLDQEGDDDSKQTEMETAINQQCQSRGPLVSIGHRSEYKYESQATQPYFNNQNTTVMVARSCEGFLMVMHETRIFYFEYVGHSTCTGDVENGGRNSINHENRTTA